MPGISLNDGLTQSLVTALDGLSTRQRVISDNIANVDTPGFKTSEVSFEQSLKNATQDSSELAMATTNSQHISNVVSTPGVSISTSAATSQRLDGNNVDLEREMANVAETTIQYQAVTRLMSKHLGLLRMAVLEGRR